MESGGRSPDGSVGFGEGNGEFERGLAAKLDDDAFGVFRFDDVEDIFFREGFKVEAIARIVVGGDGFGVGVDHDGLKALVS